MEFIQFWNDISENKPISNVDKICRLKKEEKEEPPEEVVDKTERFQKPCQADVTTQSDMYTMVKDKVDKTTEKVLNFWNFISEYKD